MLTNSYVMREDLKMAVTIVLFNNVTPTSIKKNSPSALCLHLLVLHVDLSLVIPLHVGLYVVILLSNCLSPFTNQLLCSQNTFIVTSLI